MADLRLTLTSNDFNLKHFGTFAFCISKEIWYNGLDHEVCAMGPFFSLHFFHPLKLKIHNCLEYRHVAYQMIAKVDKSISKEICLSKFYDSDSINV